MRRKISDLHGTELDMWVWLALGKKLTSLAELPLEDREGHRYWFDTFDGDELTGSVSLADLGSPSSDWSIGGPLLEESSVELARTWMGYAPVRWTACIWRPRRTEVYADVSMLVAGMRTIVANAFRTPFLPEIPE